MYINLVPFVILNAYYPFSRKKQESKDVHCWCYKESFSKAY